MKATGEVMGIGATLEECMLKSVRSLENGAHHLRLTKFDAMSEDELWAYITDFRADGIFAVTELLRRGAAIEKLYEVTMITPLFLESIRKIVEMEKTVAGHKGDWDVLREAKKMGFSDITIAGLWDTGELEVAAIRKANGIVPVFPMVDTLHTGAYIPYLYSSYHGKNVSIRTDKKKIVVLGAGPIRIGQGVEIGIAHV